MDSLTIDLFERGMSPVHRAGLGGLACTCSQLKWPARSGDRPRRWTGDSSLGRGCSRARVVFGKLYAHAFDLKEGSVIHLPGAYDSSAGPRGSGPSFNAACR